MAKVKPKIDDIKELEGKLIPKYGGLINKFQQDEEFYELKFGARLNIPEQFKADKVILPTGRDVVDTYVDHINIKNCRVFIDKNSTKDIDKKRQEEQRRFYLGVLYMTNTGEILSPWRTCAKHFAKHGLGVMKQLYVPDRPFPILIQAVHPSCVMIDPSYGQQGFVMEKHRRIVLDMAKRWGKRWKNVNGKDLSEEVDTLSYWDDTYRCELVDGEPVLGKGDVVEHGYGFIPYVFFDSGQGDISIDNELDQRYVGILRYMYDLLISESTNFSLCDILMKRETMKGGYLTGEDADGVPEIKQDYGKYQSLGVKDVQVHDWESKMPPTEAYAHLGTIHQYIQAHGAPPSLQGLSQQGVRSAAHYQQVRTEALSKYQYSEDAFKFGTQQVLINCAKLQKNVIPEGIEVRFKDAGKANTESAQIDKEKMQEPFTVHVEFSPLTFEEEFQKHLDIMQLWNNGQGVISQKAALEKMPNVDAEEMYRELQKEKIRNYPAYQQTMDQYAAQMLGRALGEVQLAQTEAHANPMTGNQNLSRGEHQLGGPHAIQTPTQQMLKVMEEQGRRAVPLGNQGQGGGGNR